MPRATTSHQRTFLWSLGSSGTISIIDRELIWALFEEGEGGVWGLVVLVVTFKSSYSKSAEGALEEQASKRPCIAKKPRLPGLVARAVLRAAGPKK